MNRQRFRKKNFIFLFSTLLLCFAANWTQAAPKALVDLVVKKQSDVGVIDIETQTLTNLTNTPNESEIALDWSSDGRKILFLSAAQGRPDQLEVMNADGTGRRALDFIKPGEVWGAWSPSGWRLVLCLKGDDNFDIYTVRPGGGDLQRLTEHPADDISPEWSPDGSRIAFSSNREKGWQLYVMDADGDNLTSLTPNFDDVGSPSWSPDGRRIAFLAEGKQLFVVDTNGQNLIQLTRNLGEIDWSWVFWSPDGTRIIFNINQTIFIVDADGKDKPKPIVSKDLKSQRTPYWMPDGRILLLDFLGGGHFVVEVEEQEDSVKVKKATFLVKERLEDGTWVGVVRSVFDPDFAKLSVDPQDKLPVTLGHLKTATLLQNYPNPFNPETWIPFELWVDGSVTIQIHNVQGHLIRTFSLGALHAGSYLTPSKAAYWDGCNQTGQPVASGMYFYTLHVGQFSETRRMLLVE